MRFPESNKRPDPTSADPVDVRRAADLFKVLSHPDRLRLACALGEGRVTTQTQLLQEFDWPQSTMARHLAALRDAGLVVGERDGQEVLLRMGSPIGITLMTTVCDWLHEPGEHPTGAGRALGTVLTPTTGPRAGERS